MKPNVYTPVRAIALALFITVSFSWNPTSAQQFLTKIDGWNAYVHLPAEYNDSVHKTYPLIIFVPGLGEIGTSASKLLVHGPARFIEAGANMEFMVNGKLEKPIVISLQPIDAWPSPSVINRRIDSIILRWRIDLLRINGTGLSMGGHTWDNYVNSGIPAYTNRLASIVAMSAVVPDNPISGMSNYALGGGKWWGFEGTHDYRAMDQIRDVMNSTVLGSARYYQYNGGHCCWNTWYAPTWNENGESIYTWMLKQKRPAGANLAPEAFAGNDTGTVALVTTLPLKGFGNDPDGNMINFAWRKLSGPSGGTITNPAALQTTVTGLNIGTYKFELAITDELGAVSRDTVTINDGNLVLPLTLISFIAVEKNETVLLKWTTTEEVNTSHTEIEKMNASQQFEKIGEVRAKGFSSTYNNYEFKDEAVVPGINYYRLKMIDKDGQFTYSDIAKLQIKKNANASKTQMDVRYARKNLSININSTIQTNGALLISDGSGKILQHLPVLLNKGINNVVIPIGLPVSVYHATLVSSNEKTTQSFFVQ